MPPIFSFDQSSLPIVIWQHLTSSLPPFHWTLLKKLKTASNDDAYQPKICPTCWFLKFLKPLNFGMPEQDWISQKVKENGSQSSSNISKILETLLWNSSSNFELFHTDPKGPILVQRARLGRYVMTLCHPPAFPMTYDHFLQPKSALGCKAEALCIPTDHRHTDVCVFWLLTEELKGYMNVLYFRNICISIQTVKKKIFIGH